MKKSNKKGFTIVELVIVIAVIAILAAVLIPTFASIVNKANRSADEQAAAQMNKLITAEVDKPESMQEVKEILANNGYNHKLDPLFKDYKFAWIAEKNAIVLVQNDNVVYPKEYANYDMTKVALFNVTKVSSNKDLLKLSTGNVGILNGIDSIVLEKNLDVNEADTGDGNEDYYELKNIGNLELDGNGKTLSTNLCVQTGTSLTLNNITIDSTESDQGSSAIKPLDGAIYMSNTNVKSLTWAFSQNIGQSSDNVVGTVKDCTFDGKRSLYIGKGTWTFENCTFDGTVTVTGGNVTFKNCKFNAKDTNDGETTANAASSGAYSSDYAIVIADGRGTKFSNGKVEFTGCSVKNANGAEGNYATFTFGDGESGNKIDVKWN